MKTRLRTLLFLLMLVGAGSTAGCLGGSKKSSGDAAPSDSFVEGGAEEVLNSLEGFVLSTEQVPVAEATVTLASLSATRVTNSDGAYRFVNLPGGEHLLTVTAAGFETLSQRAGVRDGFSTVLNFTLEAAASASPYQETLPFTGQISCYGFVGSDPETGQHADCGQVDPNNQRSHEFEFGANGAQVQIETFWAPGTALAGHLAIKVETVGFGHQDVTFAYQAGGPGMKVVVGQANMEKYYPNGGLIRVTLMAGPSVTGEEAAVDVGVGLQQRFDVDFTVFYVEPGPTDFTSRPA